LSLRVPVPAKPLFTASARARLADLEMLRDLGQRRDQFLLLHQTRIACRPVVDSNAMTWTSDEMTRIGAADELAIAARRDDGTLRDPVTIWVVRLGDDLLIDAVSRYRAR
jgi:hypothetical protein